jgi:CoA:oxalate CoA-transferase
MSFTDQDRLPAILAGVKVVDFGHAAAGPYCAELLAELGADVIKVEAPSGDHFRHAQGGAVYANVNRNKRCVTLDLKQAAGLAVAKDLVRHADILVESFTPGTMDSLGLGYSSMQQECSRLVYVSVSGFGQDGPYRQRPGYDVVAQAMSGLMDATGYADMPPVRVGASLIDFGTGLFAAFGVLAALRQRDIDGKGRHIDASLLETSIGWMNYWFTYYGFTDEVPQRQGSGLTLFAPYQVFQTSDGALFIGVSTDRFFAEFCRRFALDDIARDARFATNKHRCEHRAEIAAAVQQRLAGMTTEQCRTLLQQGGIPHAPVLNVAEVLRDEHVVARDLFFTLRGEDGRSQIMPRLPVRIAGTALRHATPAPLEGQHTIAVLEELGYNEARIASLISSRAAISQQ